MVRKHRNSLSSFDADDSAREMRVFISSLIIGACIGAFATYFFVTRATRGELLHLRNQVVAIQQGQSQRCVGPRDNQHEELESRLSTCTSTLSPGLNRVV